MGGRQSRHRPSAAASTVGSSQQQQPGPPQPAGYPPSTVYGPPVRAGAGGGLWGSCRRCHRVASACRPSPRVASSLQHPVDPPNHLQGHYYPPQPGTYVSNGQMYGGWRPPYPQQPAPQYPGGAPPPGAPPPPFPHAGAPRPAAPAAPAPAAGPAQELTQTATIRNAVNLKKNTLEVAPLPGQPNKLALSFTFDASQPCAVTTFVVATEEPARGCRLAPAKQEPAPPVLYEKGVSAGGGRGAC